MREIISSLQRFVLDEQIVTKKQERLAKAGTYLPDLLKPQETIDRFHNARFREALHAFRNSGHLDIVHEFQLERGRMINSYTKIFDIPSLDIQMFGGGLTALIVRFEAKPIKGDMKAYVSKGVRLVSDTVWKKTFIEYLRAGDKTNQYSLYRRRQGGWVRLGNNPDYQRLIKNFPRPLTAQEQLQSAAFYSDYHMDNRTGEIGSLEGYASGNDKYTRRVIFERMHRLPVARKAKDVYK